MLNQRLDDYLEGCVLVEPQVKIKKCRDPHDDMFLELAVAGNAQVILSGDQDLLALHFFEGIEILSLLAFEAKYQRLG
ncbi:MAG: putative toxin-antitoxin system toxin component, PIN family [bacterium]|nr:putative toxin-antitoxin system toxin component, PIN family [bacterium]